jgi:hypothetical protein
MTDEASTMRSGNLRPFVPVALRWVSFRGFGIGSMPARNVQKHWRDIKPENPLPALRVIAR